MSSAFVKQRLCSDLPVTEESLELGFVESWTGKKPLFSDKKCCKVFLPEHSVPMMQINMTCDFGKQFVRIYCDRRDVRWMFPRRQTESVIPKVHSG
jgi:hypothetical protein